MGDVLVKKKNPTSSENLKLPKIVAPFKIDDNIIKDQFVKKNNAIEETLMKSWSDKRFESNSINKEW